MKMKILTGFVGKDPTYAYVHPFLAGARKQRQGCVPGVHTNGIPCIECPPDGADRPVPKPGKKEFNYAPE